MEFNHSSLFKIGNGDFPLNHDCILKVTYSTDCGLKFSHFTCRSQDSGKLSDILFKLPVIRNVEISSVDTFGVTKVSEIPDFVLDIKKKYL